MPANSTTFALQRRPSSISSALSAAAGASAAAAGGGGGASALAFAASSFPSSLFSSLPALPSTSSALSLSLLFSSWRRSPAQ